MEKKVNVLTVFSILYKSDIKKVYVLTVFSISYKSDIKTFLKWIINQYFKDTC